MYPAPRIPILRWIADVGADLPEAVQSRLRASFHRLLIPIVIGAVNTIAVASVAAMRLGDPVFAAIALADLCLLGLRIVLLRSAHARPDPIFATGLLWAGLQGITIALIVVSGDIVMTTVALASGLAAVGGIVGRNFAAPRYAMTQILLIDFGYKIAFLVENIGFLPLILMQSVFFVLLNWTIVNQHRTIAIQAILGEVESRRQSVTDPLTGLLNRRGLEEAFGRFEPEKAFGPAGEAPRNRVLFYLDLDGFKQVNDSLGHAVGDALLCEVGRRLRATLGPDVTLCRLGGDEFLVLTGFRDDRAAARLGARIAAAISAPYHLDGGLAPQVGVSIGVAREDAAGTLGLAELMRRADAALYAAKSAGKGHCVLHGTVPPAPDSADRIGHAA